MASLHEYFVKHGSRTLTLHKTLPIVEEKDGSVLMELIGRLHFDFDANAKFVSFYIPASEKVTSPEILALNAVNDVLRWDQTEVEVSAGFGKDMRNGRDLVFTGRIYLYSERPVSEDIKAQITREAVAVRHSIVFRSEEYAQERNRWEKPLAFISHDSRDKTTIAEPLALALTKLQCPVWYDDFSLKVGDSLRGGIESGLRECRKCILILTPNFLGNNGWTKREYDSIFTRELVEKQNVILPIWDKVRSEDVFRYSPVLADRVAAQWSEGADTVARKLLAAIGV